MRRAAALGGLGLVLVACGKEPVTIPTTRLTAADQAVCQRLVNALPDKLAGQGARKTQPAAALGGAWGDPAIVVQCQGDAPTSSGDSCTEHDGVAWYADADATRDDSAELVVSSAGHGPVLQLTVPAAYRPDGLSAALGQLAPILRELAQPLETCP
jgi:hypothetical protein